MTGSCPQLQVFAANAGTLNGSPVASRKLEKDPAGKPFAVDGPSPDGDVYVVTFTADVYEASELAFTF